MITLTDQKNKRIRVKQIVLIAVLILLSLGIHDSSSFAFVPSPRPPYSPPSRPGFKPPSRPAFFFSITATAGTNGTITPSGNVSIEPGTNKTFTLTPNPGYVIQNLMVDSNSVSLAGTYTFNSVTANHTISVSFTPQQQYFINAGASSATALDDNPHGSTSPAGIFWLNSGESKTFTFTPDPGYFIQNINVDGNSLGAMASYEFQNVNSNHSIYAYFGQTCGLGSQPCICPDDSLQCYPASTDQIPECRADKTVDWVIHMRKQIDHKLLPSPPPTHKNILSVYNPPQQFQYNQNSWASDLDLTGIVYYQDGGFTKTGTLISPRHFVTAAHFGLPVGTHVTFITKSGAPVVRTVVGRKDLAADISVGYLDQDVPASIKHYSILPANWDQYFSFSDLRGHIPSLFVDQELKAIVADSYVYPNPPNQLGLSGPYDPTRIKYFETIAGGDSGHPAFLTMNNQLVLVFTVHNEFGGPFYPAYIQNVNQAMHDLDTGNTGYQITQFNFVQAQSMICPASGASNSLSSSENISAENDADQFSTFAGNAADKTSAPPNSDSNTNQPTPGSLATAAAAPQTITLTKSGNGASQVVFAISRPPFSPPSRPGFRPPARPAFFYNITATTGANGSISPTGDVAVVNGNNQVFTIVPNSSYKISQVVVDGSLMGAVSSYTFSNVTANHTISATFALASPSSTLSLSGYNEGSTISLGSVPSASRLTKTITVAYSGSAPATQFSAVASSGPFSVQSTTCGSSISADCTIVLAYMSNEVAAETATLSMFYFDGVSQKQKNYSLQGTSTLNDAQHVLVVYDQNNADSVEVKDYYLANRPGIKSANVISVALPQDSDYLVSGKITLDNFNNLVRAPIVSWIQNHPDKIIYYIVLVYPFPSRMVDWDTGQIALARAQILRSVATRLESATLDLNIVNGLVSPNRFYNIRCFVGCNNDDKLTPNVSSFAQYLADYPGQTNSMALVTHLHMGSKEATRAYIDKLKSVHSQMTNPNVIISGENAGIGGSTYYLEDVGTSNELPTVAAEANTYLLKINPRPMITFRARGDTHITSASNVKGYITYGANGGLGGNYAIDGTVKFSGKSSWYLIRTGESYNGMLYGNNYSLPDYNWQGWFGKWFTKNAFGGVNYENTPVGAVGHTEEPTALGFNLYNYLTLWERGYLFIDAAWASRAVEAFIAVGDPLTKK